MYSFCTYFDQRYLAQGLALFRSLTDRCRAFRLWVLCLDGVSYEALVRLDRPNLHAIRLEDFEGANAELLAVKADRSLVEYYFTCTPFLPEYILDRHPEVDAITYLDADLYFFADPALIFREIGDASVAITPHRYIARLRDWPEKYGVYNVGWITFRRDDNARRCLRWWRARCLEWCHDRVEDGRYGDQKYLDEWPTRFPGVAVLRQKGVNVAPWNYLNYQIRRRRSRLWVDDEPLVFYHFHRLNTIWLGVYDPHLPHFGPQATRALVRLVYRPYLRVLSELQFRLSRTIPGISFRTRIRYVEGDFSGLPWWQSVARRAAWFLRVGHRVLRGRFVVSLTGCAARFFGAAGGDGRGRSWKLGPVGRTSLSGAGSLPAPGTHRVVS